MSIKEKQSSLLSKIDIYKDDSINFEINNSLEKILDFILIPTLNLIPSKFNKLVRMSNSSAKDVIDNKTTHKALEILYHKGKNNKKSFKDMIFRRIWFNTNNSKGVRNRLKIVKNEIKKAINTFSHNGDAVNILSIASGSARAVLEAVRDSDIPEDYNVTITFLDKNPEALEYSKKLVQDLGISKKYNLKWINDTVSNFPKYFKNIKPNIIEMVGLLDYFSKEKTQKTLTTIRENLFKDGVFIGANIAPNNEMKFVTNLIGWKMDYKTSNELIDIAKSAGFDIKKTTVLYEPLKVHSVIIAKK